MLDSESEEEEGTQAYEVFPALSRTASPALAAATSEAMEVDDVEGWWESAVCFCFSVIFDLYGQSVSVCNGQW